MEYEYRKYLGVDLGSEYGQSMEDPEWKGRAWNLFQYVVRNQVKDFKERKDDSYISGGLTTRLDRI